MFAFQKIIERRIKEAQESGEFDNLPGQGKPLSFEDDQNIPEELRLVYKILRNADVTPPELQLRKEIRTLEDMLDNIPDEKEKLRHIKKINYKIMQLNMMGKGSPLLDESQFYYHKVLEKTDRK